MKKTSLKNNTHPDDETPLTKRERFAALAVQGIMASSPQSPLHGFPEYSTDLIRVTRIAVDVADYLIIALNENNDKH